MARARAGWLGQQTTQTLRGCLVNHSACSTSARPRYPVQLCSFGLVRQPSGPDGTRGFLALGTGRGRPIAPEGESVPGAASTAAAAGPEEGEAQPPEDAGAYADAD